MSQVADIQSAQTVAALRAAVANETSLAVACEDRLAKHFISPRERIMTAVLPQPVIRWALEKAAPGSYGFAIRANDLNVRRRIDLAKDFCGRPSSCNDRWFMRDDASAGMQRFGNEKLGSDVALAYVLFECCSDRIVIVRVHGGAEAAPYL